MKRYLVYKNKERKVCIGDKTRGAAFHIRKVYFNYLVTYFNGPFLKNDLFYNMHENR